MQPAHVAQASRLQILDGLGGGIHAERLVGGEFLRRHAGLFRRGEQRHHAAALLGQGDLLVGCEQAVEHAPHLVGEFDVQRLQLSIDRQQPGAEALEQPLQFDAGSFALEQVRLETTRELLVIGALFLEVEVVPLGQVLDAEPAQQRVVVGKDLTLSRLEGIHAENLGFLLQLGGDVRLHFQEEVAGLVQK